MLRTGFSWHLKSLEYYKQKKSLPEDRFLNSFFLKRLFVSVDIIYFRAAPALRCGLPLVEVEFGQAQCRKRCHDKGNIWDVCP